MEIVSKKVFVRQRPRVIKREGEQYSDQDANKYIGSQYRNQEVLRGLDYDEEKRYLKDILGTNPNSEKWEESCKRYWANIRKRVPYGMGLELEIGFKYENLEAMQKGEADGTYETKQTHGRPINVSDYILWRYCLVYGRVARTVADVNNSNKIRFYIHDVDVEIDQRHAMLELRKKAMAKYIAVVGDRELVQSLLIIYNNPAYLSNKDKDKDLALDAEMTLDPRRFLATVDDPQLTMKALIENAILHGKLRRIDNTDTIIYGDNTPIGNSTDEAVAYLRNPNNVKVLNNIKASLSLLKSVTPVAPPVIKSPPPVTAAEQVVDTHMSDADLPIDEEELVTETTSAKVEEAASKGIRLIPPDAQ